MLTLLGFLALGMIGAGTYFGFQLLSVHLADSRAIATRKLDLEERSIAIRERQAKSVAPPVSMPSDLFRRITRWGDQFAQDAERKTMLDLYAEFEDWDKVRQHLPPEPNEDALPSEIFVG